MRYAIALPRVYVSPRFVVTIRYEPERSRPATLELARPIPVVPEGHDRHVYRAFVAVSLAKIVPLKIVSLEQRFCPTHPTESLMFRFFPSVRSFFVTMGSPNQVWDIRGIFY